MNGPSSGPTIRRLVVLPLVVLLVLTSFTGTAAAAPVQGAGPTVIVEEGETVDGIHGLYGTVVIHGTVTGNVEVATGSLVINGEVQGDVSGAAGSVDIRGRVGGDVSVGAGSLTVAEGAVIGGQLDAGAGSAQIAGTVNGDANIEAGSIVLAPTATFQEDLRYDGDLTNRGATIEGELIRDESLGGAPVAPPGGNIAFNVFGFLANLGLGIVLLFAFPIGSRRLAQRVVDEPLRSGLYGLIALVGVPILLVLVALTIIGIPLALVGFILFGLAVWVGSVFGRYTVGEWLLGYTDTENRWIALLVGMLAIALVGFVPFLGGLVQFLVLLLGLGGLGAVVVREYRRRRQAGATTA